MVSISLQPHGLDYVGCQTPLSMGFPRKPIVDCHLLLEVIFPIQGLNLHLLHRRVDSLPLSHQGSCTIEYYSAIKNNEIMPFAASWMDLETVTE